MWLQFAKVSLHTCRFELERTDSSSVAVKLVCSRVFYVDIIHVYFHTQTLPHILHCLFQDAQSLQSEEVHLDKSCFLYDMSVILCAAHLLACLLIIGCAYRYPVIYRVSTDDGSAGMYTRIPDVVLQHDGITHRVAKQRIGRCSGILQLRHTLNCIRQCHLLSVRQFVGNSLAERIAYIERHLLYSCHILYCQLRCHRAVGDDMSHLLGSVFLGNPLQHLASSVVVEVGIDIGQ